MAKRVTTNDIMEVLQDMKAQMSSFDERLTKLEGVSGKDASVSKRGAKSAPAKTEQPKVAFTKRNGEVIYGTEKQVEVWKKAVERSDAYKAVAKEITDAGRAYVKAHPSCTRKEAAANGCPHITKDELKALKIELGVRTAK